MLPLFLFSTCGWFSSGISKEGYNLERSKFSIHCANCMVQIRFDLVNYNLIYMRLLAKELIFRFFFTRSVHDHSGGHQTVVKGRFNGGTATFKKLYF